MSTTLTTSLLARALTSTIRHRSAWSRFGKWVLTGLLVGVVILALLLICCCVVFRRVKKSRLSKHARDTEAGIYKSKKVYESAYNAPAQSLPARIEPNRTESQSNGSILAHDYVIRDDRQHAQYNTAEQERSEFAQTRQIYNGNGHTGRIDRGNVGQADHASNGNNGLSGNGNNGYTSSENTRRTRVGNSGYTTHDNTGYTGHGDGGYTANENNGYAEHGNNEYNDGRYHQQ